MIRMFYLNGSQKLISIEGIPDEALPIVKKYEPLFDQDSVVEDSKWSEFSDLSFEDAKLLQNELKDAGFGCEICEYKVESI